MYLDDERLYPLFDRYLAGEASSTDAAAVQEWLAQDPDHTRLLDDLRLIRRAAAGRAPNSSTDRAWATAVGALRVAPQPRVSRRLLMAAPPPPAVVIPRGGGGALPRPGAPRGEIATP